MKHSLADQLNDLSLDQRDAVLAWLMAKRPHVLREALRAILHPCYCDPATGIFAHEPYCTGRSYP